MSLQVRTASLEEANATHEQWRQQALAHLEPLKYAHAVLLSALPPEALAEAEARLEAVRGEAREAAEAQVALA